MKKLLLGTSILFTSLAFAQDTEIKLNGIFDFSATIFNQNPPNNYTIPTKLNPLNESFDFRSSSAFFVLVSNTSKDEQWKYGAKITIPVMALTKGSPKYNGSHIFLENDNIGKFQFGSPFDAMNVMSVTGLSVARGIGTATVRYAKLDDMEIQHYDFTSDDLLKTNNSFEPARKISYYTPKLYDKIEFGFSYTPNTSNNGGLKPTDMSNIKFRDITNTNYSLPLAAKNVISFGSTMTHDISKDIGLKIGLSGEFGSAVQQKRVQDTTTKNYTYENLTGNQLLSDLKAMNIGALLTYKNLSFAASFATTFDSLTSEDFDGKNRNTNYFSTGASYTQGPIGVSINYLNTQLRGNTTFNAVILGGDYAVAKGVRSYGELGWFSADDIDKTKNPSGFIIAFGTSIAF